jgi:magnesium chelatase family protein
MPSARTYSVALAGLSGHVVEIEAEITNGPAAVTLAGLPETSLREMRDRVRAAIINSGERWPQRTITALVSPASLPKRGSAFDTAIAVAILAADGALPAASLANVVFLAELGLDGRLRPVPGTLPAIAAASAAGIDTAVVAAGYAAEAALVPDIRTVAAGSLAELVAWLGGGPAPAPATRQPCLPTVPEPRQLDLADIPGQTEAKFAAEVGAAGGHHLSLVGPPGTGKTLLAGRLSVILPRLDPADALEVTAIHSVAGILPPGAGLITEPPLRAPHHTASKAAVIGGGSSILRPGDAPLAHHGVLLLDQAPDFARDVLDALRQPLETGEVVVARAGLAARFPARFILVVTADPCPCGALTPDASACTPAARRRYLGRISAPLLERIEIKTTLQPTSRAGLACDGNPAESSQVVAARVAAARDRAARRLAGTPWRVNAEIPSAELRRSYLTAPGAFAAAERALDLSQISRRAAASVARVAWTLADLDGKPGPGHDHCTQALSLVTGDVTGQGPAQPAEKSWADPISGGHDERFRCSTHATLPALPLPAPQRAAFPRWDRPAVTPNARAPVTRSGAAALVNGRIPCPGKR